MNFRRHLNTEELHLNLTPLIDLVLILLIFFILTTNFIDENYLEIVLPETESAPQQEKQGLEVVVDQDGNYIIGGRKLINNRRETLHTALQRQSQGKGYEELKITADERASHGKIVVLMDIGGKLGFSNIRITTRSIDNK